MSFLKNKKTEQLSYINSLSSGKERVELTKIANNLFDIMNDVGVDNEKDYRDFFYIKNNASYFYKEINKINPTNKEIAIISSIIFNKRNDNPINTIPNFYKATKYAINSLETINKKAYPQGYEGSHIQPPYNLPKWVEAMRQVYILKNKGLSKYDALDKVTEKWNTMETNDFKHWFKFYESNSHLAYKTASDEEQKIPSDMDGLYVSMPVLNNTVQENSTINEEEVNNKEDIQKRPYKRRSRPELTLNEKVNRLIGRLNSAEKLYTSDNFRELLGNEYEAWLSTLHQLKRKIQISVFKNATTVDDVVVGFSNKLISGGLVKTAGLILKVAQEASVAPPPVGSGGDIKQPKEENTESPTPPLPPPPASDEPSGDLFSDIPPSSFSENDEGIEDEEDLNDPEGAMIEFMENLGVKSNKKEASVINNDEIIVTEEDLYNYKKAQLSNESLPSKNITPSSGTVPAKPVNNVQPQMIDKNINRLNPEPVKHEFDIDDRIDSAFKNITIDDVITKLDSLVLYYKNRPAVSELTKIDLAMQQLGLAAYFPNMAEATKSALDSNQYVLTRIEDILAKLKGAYSIQSGQLEKIKDKFDEAEDLASEKKQRRQLEKMEDDGSEEFDIKAPLKQPEEIDIQEEIKNPPQVQPSNTPGVRVT
jgi:hypothetical protein